MKFQVEHSRTLGMTWSRTELVGDFYVYRLVSPQGWRQMVVSVSPFQGRIGESLVMLDLPLGRLVGLEAPDEQAE